MPVLFISDLHLDPSYPITTEKFLQLLRNEARQTDALYLLGDIFEAWIGDDVRNSWISSIKTALKQLSETGIPIYIMHGNRDFLIGKRFLQETACHLLPDPSVISIYGKKILLMHGDTLCLSDTSYLRFRRFNRSSIVQRVFLALPISIRRRIINKVRNISVHKDTQLQDITASEIPRLMQDHQVEILIHGHTHRPSIHYLNLNKNPLLHIVLSDWTSQGNVLSINKQQEIRLTYF